MSHPGEMDELTEAMRKAQSAVAALVSLLALEPALIAAWREAKAAERTLNWVAGYIVSRAK